MSAVWHLLLGHVETAALIFRERLLLTSKTDIDQVMAGLARAGLPVEP